MNKPGLFAEIGNYAVYYLYKNRRNKAVGDKVAGIMQTPQLNEQITKSLVRLSDRNAAGEKPAEKGINVVPQILSVVLFAGKADADKKIVADKDR